ncbi:MAG: hypothetical protein MI867_27285 [Pseudomonadales bacterium]|nr:hypothetical protein [Pseudomonadales bacterium]
MISIRNKTWIIFSLLTFALNVYATELPPLNKHEAFKPILVGAADLPAQGMKISELSLAAIIDDTAEPIPFQIDEYNEGGAIYFPDWDVPLAGVAGVFDEQDKLLFIYKDAGPRREDYHIFDGRIIAEIELEGDDGVSRFVYLVHGAKLTSDEQYVRYASAHARVETDFYNLTYDPKNHLNWGEFLLDSYTGGEYPLDSMKLRLNAGLLTSANPIELTNNDLIATPSGERIGPIRTTTQLSVTVWIMNLPVLKLSSQLHHYPKGLQYDVRVMIPKMRRKLLVDPSFSMSIDANNLMGATLRSALGPELPGIVDGQIDDIERQMIKAGVTKTDNWLWASTGEKLDLIAYLDLVADSNPPVSLFLKDEKDSFDPPEKFVGQLPNLGYTIDKFPEEGFFGYVISMIFSDGFEGDPKFFSRYLRTAPDIKVNVPN